MRVALTGGSGFIGTAMVRVLVADDVPVRALARSVETEGRRSGGNSAARAHRPRS